MGNKLGKWVDAQGLRKKLTFSKEKAIYQEKAASAMEKIGTSTSERET